MDAPPPSISAPPPAPVAGRAELLIGPITGIDVATGPANARVWPNAAILFGVPGVLGLPLALAPTLGVRLGVESPPLPVGPFVPTWYGGVGSTIAMSGGGDPEPSVSAIPFLAVGTRFRFSNGVTDVTISPGLAWPLGFDMGGDLGKMAGSSTLLGSLTGLLPPLVEVGWRVSPGVVLSLRTALPLFALRTDF